MKASQLEKEMVELQVEALQLKGQVTVLGNKASVIENQILRIRELIKRDSKSEEMNDLIV
jgi:hypothetical protein